jgi:hypothetical protein
VNTTSNIRLFSTVDNRSIAKKKRSNSWTYAWKDKWDGDAKKIWRHQKITGFYEKKESLGESPESGA